MKERSTNMVSLRFVRRHGRWGWQAAVGLLREPVVEEEEEEQFGEDRFWEERFGKERILFEVVRVA
jgi:hypothetical protein